MHRRPLSGCVVVALAFASASCDSGATSTKSASAPVPMPVGLDGSEPEDGQWVMPAKNYASTRYSGLDQITTGNVQGLKVAWSFATGVLHGHEAAPLIVNGTMYVITPFPNLLHALDATSGRKKWTYDPHASPAAQGVACCDVVNRGGAYSDGRIYYNTLDMHTVAVDAETGKEVWKTKLGDINQGESITMAPLVAKGKVFVGNSGGEFGVRGWITALDAASGKIAWRAHSTGPDSDVLIGANFHPFYEGDRGKDLGVSTWPPDMWRIGGGSVWGWISYDPELDLIFHGTSNPGPWNPEIRPGDNKWTAALFARKPDTGEAVWAYQWSPHDLYDYDGINENILVNLTIGGTMRKTLIRPERNGYVYVLDRTTGEVLSADPFVHTTTTSGVDLKTGRPNEVKEKATGFGKTVREICPAAPGGKDWQPSAFSPRTGMLYIPHNNLCMDMEGVQASYLSGTPYVGAVVKMYAGPGGNRGEFTAWDPVNRRRVWSIPEKFPAWSGALVTAGDVVFYGTMDRFFKAVNARTGDVLWQTQLGSGIISQPVTYRGSDGKQYVAVMDGVGGWAGAIVAGDLDPRDGTGALGFVNAMKDLPDVTARGGAVYVFSLDE